MKKGIKIISVLMAVLTFLMALPLTAFAAKQEVYIKEIRISTDANDEAAKQWLTENGYTILDVNLNQKTGKDSVYIGYLTTTNPDEAITDISLMQMDGGYSFSEYEAMVEKRREEINYIIDSLAIAINEAKTNYRAGKKGAVSAYTLLNRFREDDSGMLLGDLLYSDVMDKDTINKVFLQGNGDVATVIYNMLALACTEFGEGSTWLDKLATMDIYADYDPLLYNDTAGKMYDSFVEVQDMLIYYANTCRAVEENFNEEEYEALTDEEKADYFPEDYHQAVVMNHTLEGYKFGTGTMKDFFLKDPDEIDLDEFYPLLAAMTPGEQSILAFVGYPTLISMSQNDEDAIDRYIEECIASFMTQDIISVYANVDRSLYEGGVALTNASLRKSASTGETPWYSNDNIDQGLNIALSCVAGAAAVGAITTAIVGNKLAVRAGNAAAMAAMELPANQLLHLSRTLADKVAVECAWRGGITVQAGEDLWMALSKTAVGKSAQAYPAMKATLGENLLVIEDFVADLDAQFAKAQAEVAAKGSQAKMAAMSRVMTTVNTIAWVTMGISLIAEGIKIGIKVYNYYHPDYTEIPRIIVDEVVTDTDSYYVNYYAVKDQNGNLGDLNAWAAQRWNAIYTTTDRNAGDPIIASSLSAKLKDSSFPGDNSAAVHYFGEEAAANVNRYNFRATAPATYLFYERDHSLSMTASTFSGGQLFMFTGFGLIGGLAIGSLSVFGIGKLKNKKKDEAES